ncbi:allophanate hydrolase subunit 1 [Kribbella sandramycini]|uniref:Allophanate hydrolase subunit 1 n=1 Tax=Kribbella sandramycini TaxID=60450 RepID=A0A7Y4KZ27_9ACTN|nr:allophanate hydrolase subunit 1 [Kribbella sandramycini]MBB6565038.1 KipI family sensor histidine kinase inhibitor [Kribbella sandramycini]NOL41310.1 allophanate hydrolase subunit 1 [Kribbella sandramycini]
MRILPAGDRALLVELDDLDEVLGYYAALLAEHPADVVDIVPAARTVLVTTSGSLEPLERHLRAVRPTQAARNAGDLLEVPVVYDGADLADVAELLGCSTAEVVERHTQEEWTVAFCGFAPGFGYLTGTADWSIPRRSSPRTKVPVGAVGLAGEFSGVYPRESPGGWQLIGRTSLQIFDQSRDPAALFHPGRQVRFVDAGC